MLTIMEVVMDFAANGLFIYIFAKTKLHFRFLNLFQNFIVVSKLSNPIFWSLNHLFHLRSQM